MALVSPNVSTPIYFVTFATSNYSKTLERIKKQAEDFQLFEKIYCLTETDISNEFWQKHADFIRENPRGFGCWIWKPFVVKTILNQLPQNSILFYCDAGSTLFKEGKPRFQKYIQLVKKSIHSNLSFQMDLSEIQFTRKSILDLLEYTNVNTGQLLGGIFFLQKTNYTQELVNLWYELSQNYDLIGDVPDNRRDYENSEFIENRHDQSIFSVIRKKYGTTSIRDETYFGENYETYKQFPIHATRLKY